MAVQCWQSLLPAVVPIPLDTLQTLLASAGDEEGNSSTQQTNNAPLGKERPLRILIVEDEILTADYTKYLLLEMGYEVCGHATNAAAAVRMADTYRPDLVLMDITLGRGEDGISAARRIGEQLGIRSLFVTAYGDRVTLDRVQTVNPLGVVLKPFDKERLRSAIAAAKSAF
jgi:two-component system, response regulator PdtaR